MPLVTGDRIEVIDRGENRTIHAPNVIETAETTYALPSDRDPVFDRSLFDVDALLAVWADSGGPGNGDVPEDGDAPSGGDHQADRDSPEGSGRQADGLPVLIETSASADQIAGPGVHDVRSLPSEGVVAATLPWSDLPGAVGAIRNRTQVERIALDRRIDGLAVTPPERTQRRIERVERKPVARFGTSDVRHEPPDTGSSSAVRHRERGRPLGQSADQPSGENVTVAVIDTGIDDSHPDLKGRVVDRVDLVDDGTTGDPVGHGTAVAGIVAGAGTAGELGREGIAPEAELIDVRALGPNGRGRASKLIEGIEYAVKEADADVVVMSIGGSVSGSEDISSTIEWATERGTLVVTSAGNRGERRTIDATGRPEAALTVGAYDHETGGIAAFSSRGPTNDGRVKPDVIARGTAVPVPASGDAYNRTYHRLWGTSFATPRVAGLAALLLDANPDLTPAAVRNRIVATARHRPVATVFEQGSGRIDPERALDPAVLVTPSTLSIGGVDDDRQRTLTVENRGTRTRTIEFTPSIERIDDRGESPSPEIIDLNRTTITVAPGETERVSLHVANLSAGTYSATLRYRVGDRPRSVAIGIVDGGEITVEKRRLDGTLAGDESQLFAFSAGGEHQEIRRFENGTASFFASGGQYVLWSTRTDETRGTTVIVSERRTFEGPERVVLDERETVPVGIDHRGLTYRYGALEAFSKTASMTGTTGGDSVSWDVSTDRSAAPTVRASRDPNLELGISMLLVPEQSGGSGGPLDADDVFHLAWGTDGVEGDPEYVGPRDLDTTLVEYHRSTVDERLAVEFRANPEAARLHNQRIEWPLDGRRQQRVHRLVPGAAYGIRLAGDGIDGTASVDVGGRRLGPVSRTTPRRTIERFAHPQHPAVALTTNDSGGEPTPTVVGTPRSDGDGTAITPANGTIVVEAGDDRRVLTPGDQPIETALDGTIDRGDDVHLHMSTVAPNATLSPTARSELFVDEYDPNDDTIPSIEAIDVPNADATSALTDDEATIIVDGEAFDQVIHSRLWYTVGTVEDPPWKAPDRWHRVPTDRSGYTVQGTVPLDEHDLPGIAPSDPLAVDDTAHDDRPETVSVAVAVETTSGHRARAMVSDAVRVGSAPNEATVDLGGTVTDLSSEHWTDMDRAHPPSVLAVDATDRRVHAREAVEPDGSFVLSVPRNRTYDLVYQRPAGPGRPVANRTPQLHPIQRVDASDDQWLGSSDLPNGTPLSLQVVDQRDRPVENATVEYRIEAGDARTTLRRAETDSKGVAVFPVGGRSVSVSGAVNLTVVSPEEASDLAGPVQRTITPSKTSNATVALPLTPPTAALSASDSVVERGSTVTFSAADSEVATQNATYRWDLTGDGRADRVTEEPSRSLLVTTVGNRTVSVTVVDEVGNEATTSVTVEVRPSPPSDDYEVRAPSANDYEVRPTP